MLWSYNALLSELGKIKILLCSAVSISQVLGEVVANTFDKTGQDK